MNPKALAVVAFRVLSVYLVIWGLTNLSQLYGLFRFQQVFPPQEADSLAVIGSLTYALAIAVPILGGLVLWKWAPGLAVRVVKEEVSGSGEASFSLVQIQAVALTTAGLLLIFWVLPSFLVGIYELLARTPPGYSALGQNPFKATNLVSMFLEILLGLWLVLGARSWTRLLHRFQEFGLEGKR